MNFRKKLLFMIILFFNKITDQYQISPIIQNKCSLINNINMIKPIVDNIPNNVPNNVPNNIPNILDNFLDITVQEKYIGRIIVEKISALLPHVDSIGHNILHANNEFINYILEHNLFSDETKKSIILGSIRLAQYGDDAGSHLLQLYYNIVEKCL